MRKLYLHLPLIHARKIGLVCLHVMQRSVKRELFGKWGEDAVLFRNFGLQNFCAAAWSIVPHSCDHLSKVARLVRELPSHRASFGESFFLVTKLKNFVTRQKG
jgi:hypothetical protein